MYFCLSEDVTVGIERTALTKVIVAAATTEHIAMHVTLVEFYISLTGLVDTLQHCCPDRWR